MINEEVLGHLLQLWPFWLVPLLNCLDLALTCLHICDVIMWITYLHHFGLGNVPVLEDCHLISASLWIPIDLERFTQLSAPWRSEKVDSVCFIGLCWLGDFSYHLAHLANLWCQPVSHSWVLQIFAMTCDLKMGLQFHACTESSLVMHCEQLLECSGTSKITCYSLLPHTFV